MAHLNKQRSLDTPHRDHETYLLGLELLRIKPLIRHKRYRAEDVKVYLSCLAIDQNLALIAAGYALSENFDEVKANAVSVLARNLADIAKDGLLPGKWPEIAILEGLALADDETLLVLEHDLIYYLRRLLFVPNASDERTNLNAVLRRLARLGVAEAAELLEIR